MRERDPHTARPACPAHPAHPTHPAHLAHFAHFAHFANPAHADRSESQKQTEPWHDVYSFELFSCRRTMQLR